MNPWVAKAVVVVATVVMMVIRASHGHRSRSVEVAKSYKTARETGQSVRSGGGTDHRMPAMLSRERGGFVRVRRVRGLPGGPRSSARSRQRADSAAVIRMLQGSERVKSPGPLTQVAFQLPGGRSGREVEPLLNLPSTRAFFGT